MNRLASTTLCVLALLTLASCCVQAIEYRVQLLPVPDYCASSLATGINDRGQIVGHYQTKVSPYHFACLWDSDGFHDLGLRASWPQINNNGIIAAGPNMWKDGVTYSLPPPVSAGHNSYADVNDSGVVTGYSCVSENPNCYHACYWDDEGVHDLGVWGTDPSSEARAINDEGQVVGGSFSGYLGGGDMRYHAMLWDNGTTIPLGSLPGYSESVAWGVNNLGQVVGYARNYGSMRAFLWQDGVMTDFLGGSDTYSRASAITDSGLILGEGGPAHRSFIWHDGELTWLPGTACAINENGWVVGGSMAAVLMVPVPEPSPLIALLGSLACLPIALRRRRALCALFG